MISNEELAALMQAIKGRYGLDFTNYERGSLKRGITRLMMKNKMSSLIELWSTVLGDEEFFKRAIDDLLVNLTELFRNPDVWGVVKSQLLKEFQGKQLKVWHAGCSTGEEVYTMAIVLDDMNMLHQTRATATDLSSKALEKAKEGSYSLILLKQYLKPFLEFYPQKKLEDFFDFHQSHAEIKPKFKSHVTFSKHNLVNQPIFEKYDIIFCRNVMIYFDENLKKKVLDLLYKTLNPGGYLVIGYYDIMPDYGKTLFKIHDIKTRIYQKKS